MSIVDNHIVLTDLIFSFYGHYRLYQCLKAAENPRVGAITGKTIHFTTKTTTTTTKLGGLESAYIGSSSQKLSLLSFAFKARQ